MALGHDDTATVLENIVDRHGLATVLDMLADIASEKSEHVTTVWRDKPAARKWSRAYRVLSRVALQTHDIA